MNDFARDVWQDLRDKRLWPIAVLLALAIVAIPLLLTKSAAQPAAENAVVPTQSEETRVAVSRDDGDAASSGTGSALDRFAEGDPFTPPRRIASNGGGDSATAGASAAGPSDSGGSAEGDGAAPPSSRTDAPVPQPPVTRTETSEYEYVADVTFWNGERRRELRGLRKLDMLPNQSAPVLIFMGTSAQGGNAVFLVDSTLRTTGEGRCVPDRANCAYVHIGPGAEQIFTTEAGDAFRLRIDEIRRTKVRAGASAARPSARAADGAVRRFALPSLVDLVEVDTTTTTATTTAGDSSAPVSGR